MPETQDKEHRKSAEIPVTDIDESAVNKAWASYAEENGITVQPLPFKD